VIFGVFLGRDPAASHAFMQTLDGASGRSTYHRYPLDAFHAGPGELDIQIGPNRLRRDGVSLDIDTPERQMKGELRFSGQSPWPVTPLSPGIMGWYAFVPRMECYHGVLSFDHELSGALTIDGQVVDFTGGRGYREKEWGQAFPKAWIWMQSNHFARHPGASLSASVAIVPWLGSAFPGFVVGLWRQQHLYRFATYSGAVIEHLDVDDTHVTWRLASRRPLMPGATRHRLEIAAWRSEGGLLHSPERVDMQQRVTESLTARLDVRLVAVRDGRETVLFEDSGRHAGLEIAGPTSEIQKMITRDSA